MTSSISIAAPSSLLFVNAVDSTTRVNSLPRQRKSLKDVLDEVFDILQQNDGTEGIDSVWYD